MITKSKADHRILNHQAKLNCELEDLQSNLESPNKRSLKWVKVLLLDSSTTKKLGFYSYIISYIIILLFLPNIHLSLCWLILLHSRLSQFLFATLQKSDDVLIRGRFVNPHSLIETDAPQLSWGLTLLSLLVIKPVLSYLYYGRTFKPKRNNSTVVVAITTDRHLLRVKGPVLSYSTAFFNSTNVRGWRMYVLVAWNFPTRKGHKCLNLRIWMSMGCSQNVPPPGRRVFDSWVYDFSP